MYLQRRWKGGNDVSFIWKVTKSIIAGFTLTTSRDSCTDIDECASNPSLCGNGTCVNTVGSYRCHCNLGFQVGTVRNICAP